MAGKKADDRLTFEIDWVQQVAAWLDPTKPADRALRGYGLAHPSRTRDRRYDRSPDPAEPNAAAGDALTQLTVVLQEFPVDVCSDTDLADAKWVLGSIIRGRDRQVLIQTGRCEAMARVAKRLKYINTLIAKYTTSEASTWETVAAVVREHLAGEHNA